MSDFLLGMGTLLTLWIIPVMFVWMIFASSSWLSRIIAIAGLLIVVGSYWEILGAL